MSALLARGKDYIPLLGENKVWSVAHEKHALIGDTVINEITYHKLYFHNFLEELTPDSLEYIAAMREDTINRKVYYIWKNFDSEKLLYDFALQVGDTFQTNSALYGFDFGPASYYSSYSQKYYAISITDSLIDGVSRRVIGLNIHPMDAWSKDWFIEGVGSPFGLIYAGHDLVNGFNVNPYLLCVHQADVLVHQEFEALGVPINECYSEPELSVREIENRYNDIYVSPSLFDNKLNIRSSEPITEILISDINGRIVYQYRSSENISQLSINVAHWDSGLYIVRAGNSQHFVSKKIIKL